ncbi:MAG: hypothetical protein RL203_559, partial [Pseudomonadota bacterium]
MDLLPSTSKSKVPSLVPALLTLRTVAKVLTVGVVIFP